MFYDHMKLPKNKLIKKYIHENKLKMLASLVHMNAVYKQQSQQTERTVKIPSSPSSLLSSQGNPQYLVHSVSISHDMAL